MLRDYLWSLTFVVVLLLAYTAVVMFKKPIEANRAAASIKPEIIPYAPTTAATHP